MPLRRRLFQGRLFSSSIGLLNIEETDGSKTQFLIGPTIGFLREDIPDTKSISLSSDLLITPHLINIQSNEHQTQRTLRFLNGDLSVLTNRIYHYLPDVTDFFVYFSTDKIEFLPKLTRNNFFAGVHTRVQTNYSGTGRSFLDQSNNFGSRVYY